MLSTAVLSARSALMPACRPVPMACRRMMQDGRDLRACPITR